MRNKPTEIEILIEFSVQYSITTNNFIITVASLQSNHSKLYFIYMKSHNPEPPSFRHKLPYLPFNHPKKYRNQSLKKIVFHQSHSQTSSLHNIGLLPRLNKKTKHPLHNDLKSTDLSLQKNILKWNPPQSNLKKRQKLHTEAPNTEQLTEADQSFVSLTNKLLHPSEDVKDTMFDFRKKIQQNKLIIKKEIEKKNKQNHSSGKRQKSFIKKKRINSSRVLDESPEYQKRSKNTLETPISKSKLQVSLKQLGSSKRKNKVDQRIKRQKTQIENQRHESVKSLPKRQSEGLFTDLQVILDDKIKPEEEKSVKQQKKLRALLARLSKFKQQKQYSSHSIYEQPHSLSDQILHFESSTDTLSPSSKIKFKRQTNYHEWNKVDLSSTSEVSYRKSSFEEELRKVVEYTDRNDASLEKYLVMRKELMKIGFQVQLGHCAARSK